MLNDRQREAMQAALDRRKQLTPQQLQDQQMILIRTSHLLRCTPISLVDVKTQQHVWHRDQAFVLGGEGCDCLEQPFTVLGPEHFLGKEG